MRCFASVVGPECYKPYKPAQQFMLHYVNVKFLLDNVIKLFVQLANRPYALESSYSPNGDPLFAVSSIVFMLTRRDHHRKDLEMQGTHELDLSRHESNPLSRFSNAAVKRDTPWSTFPS